MMLENLGDLIMNDFMQYSTAIIAWVALLVLIVITFAWLTVLPSIGVLWVIGIL
jgi:hypothetical protein